jgi:hypothetical protein
MSTLRDALRKKFKTPREAILALGLDESLLTERAYDSANPLIKEKTMKAIKISALGSVAYGSLMTFLRPQLAMDAQFDLKKGLRNITAKNFKAKRPVLAAWISESVKDKLDPQYAQDGALNADGLDTVLDMIELACDDFPEEMKEKAAEKKDDKKAEDEDQDDKGEIDAEDDAETDEEKAARMAAREKAKDKKAKDKKGKDSKPKAMDKDVNEEDEEHDPDKPKAEDEDDMEAAMDEKINAGIQAGIRKERDRMEAIAVAKDHVRPRVGSLTMAFDSAAQVYSKAIEVASGKKPPKEASIDMLKFAFDNLPSKDGNKRQTYAMDSAPSTAIGDITKRNPDLAKNLSRIGRA